MSLYEQLTSLKGSFTNTFDTDIKKRKSLIYDDGASRSRTEAYSECKEGFDNLCVIDKKFLKFENLYAESDIDNPLALLTKEEVDPLQRQIRQYLYLITDYLEIRCTLLAVEWLIFKYEAHIHQPEDVLIACLPLHERPIFVRFVRLLNLNKKEFNWLHTVSESGRGIGHVELSVQCLKNPHILEMICGWPAKIVDVTADDVYAGRKMYQIIICLAVNILDKVCLKGSDKIEKYMSPFVMFMCEGFQSHNSDFMSTAALVLVYLSHKISLDRRLLRDSFKLMLRSNVLQDNACLRGILEIATSQNIELDEKVKKLFRSKMAGLKEKEIKVVEEKLAELLNVDCEDNCSINTVYKSEAMEEDESLIIHTRVQIKDCEIVKNSVGSLQINWTSPDLENQLISIVDTYLLKTDHVRIGMKIAHEVLEQLKRKPKDLMIQYRPAGLTAYLCVALLSPIVKVRKAIRRFLSKTVLDWPDMKYILAIKKIDVTNDPESLRRGDIARIIMLEVDSICTINSSVGVQSIVISLISADSITLVSSLTNTWNMFVNYIGPKVIDSEVKKVAIEALTKIGSSFNLLNLTQQHFILDSITTGIDSSSEGINKVIDCLSKVHLTHESVKYLLQDGNPVSKCTKTSIKKFNNNAEHESDIYSECTKRKITSILGAIPLISSISDIDQVELIQPLFVVLRNTFKNTNSKAQPNKKEPNNDMVALMTNLMSAMLTILSNAESQLTETTKASLSLKIRIEDISKCLYLFNNNLQNLILMVIQKLVKLELGLEHFNLTYFMNWIGSNVVPRDDQHSMKILNSVLEEILSGCIKIKQKSEDVSNDQVKIIAYFVKDCAGLPNHRSLMLYYNLIKSLSISKNGETGPDNSTLWIQLIFMVINKATGLNECLILPLLNKFSKEEQLYSMKKVITFLSQLIHDPSKKRKFVNDDVSNSPMQKKRKVTKGSEIKVEKVIANIEVNDFATVKEHLLSVDKDMNYASLLKTMMTYFLMQLSGSKGDLMTVPCEVLKNLISGLFGTMKVVTSTPASTLSVQTANEISVMMRQLIEAVGGSMSRNIYLELIINLIKYDSDESVQVKSLELLANKLRLIGPERNMEVEFRDIASSILAVCHKTIDSGSLNTMWDLSVSCATSIVSMGFLEQDGISNLCDGIYSALLAIIDDEAASLSPERVVLANVFLQKYVAADNGNDLCDVFRCALKVTKRCIQRKQLNNGEAESALALFHAVLSREDSEVIGWTLFESLLQGLFELATEEFSLRKLSKASLEYQKNIRMKLSRMRDTAAMVEACSRLLQRGVENENIIFVSGSVSMFGCHVRHLNKSEVKWTVGVQDTPALWSLVHRMLAFAEERPFTGQEADVFVCEEVSIKAVSQLCHVFGLDQAVLDQLSSWSRHSEQAATYLHRNSLVFRLLHHLSSKAAQSHAVVAFVNQSDMLSLASALLKHLTVDIGPKRKSRRKLDSVVTVPFTHAQFTVEQPQRSIELVRSVCSAVHAHLVAESRANVTLAVSDETIDLITSVCSTMTSMRAFTSPGQYVSLCSEHVAPLIGQLATNCSNDETLLTPMCVTLCKYFSELGSDVLLAIVKVLTSLKELLGATFDSSIRDHVSSFLEDCKLHDDEEIADMANEV